MKRTLAALCLLPALPISAGPDARRAQWPLRTADGSEVPITAP